MSDTTTTSEPRPVSALEQALRDRVMTPIRIQCADAESWAYSVAGDLVHERDKQLWVLITRLEKEASEWNRVGRDNALSDDKKWNEAFGAQQAYADAANSLRAILEGRTQP